MHTYTTFAGSGGTGRGELQMPATTFGDTRLPDVSGLYQQVPDSNANALQLQLKYYMLRLGGGERGRSGGGGR